MQIFTYVDKNSNILANSQTGYEDYSIEDFLKPQRKTQLQSAVSVPKIKVSSEDVKKELANSFLKLFTFLSKTKGILVTLLCIYVLILFVPYALAYLTYSIKPVLANYLPDSELVLLDTAMSSFIFENDIDAFDENGNVVAENDTNSSVSKMAYVTQPVTFSEYKVKPGDNITNIVRRFGLSNISTLIAVNKISNVRTLAIGEVIKIPSIDGMIHEVKKNETLSSIATDYKVTVETLLDVNDLTSVVIQKGDKIFVPGARLDSESLKAALGELFVFPLSGSWRLTSSYGYRSDPFTGVKSFHNGIDMAQPLGSTVRASRSGKVVAATTNALYGNYVIISHGNGYQTLYAHLHKINCRVGQYVDQGVKIGLLGNTGRSTGAHLHFSVYKNGKHINPYNVLK